MGLLLCKHIAKRSIPQSQLYASAHVVFISKESWLVVVAALADAEQSALAPVELCLAQVRAKTRTRDL